jgi:hypothetical protein
VGTSVTYLERLWPGPLGWLFVAGFAAAGFIVLLPVAALAAAVGAAVLAVVGVVGAAVTATVVTVRDGELRVGRAHIPVGLLGEAVVLDRRGVHAALGPGSDARAFACVRTWIPTAVTIAVVDPSDPTPTWLISTRRPEALVAAVRAAGTAGDQAAHSVQTI